MFERAAAFLREAQSKTAGSGVSSTKVVWLWAGMASIYSATLATLGGVSVYIFLGRADPVFWAATGALWVNSLGFAASVQKGQHRAATEVALGQQGGEARP